MPRSVTPFALLTLFAAAVASRAGAQSSVQPPPEIQAMAIGEVTSAPDRATIIFGVETRAATAGDASTQNATRQNAVIAALRSAGIPQERIATISYTINPEMEYDEARRTPRVVAYVARNLVRVDVREIGRLGALIDAAIRAGANNVHSLQFDSSRREELRREALQSAMRKACAEANVMAQAAGGSLGPLLSASTNDAPRPYPMPEMRMAAGAAQADTPITPGEMEIGVMVQTRWQFVPAGVTPPPGAPNCR